jgi:hypothetical protein
MDRPSGTGRSLVVALIVFAAAALGAVAGGQLVPRVAPAPVPVPAAPVTVAPPVAPGCPPCPPAEARPAAPPPPPANRGAGPQPRATTRGAWWRDVVTRNPYQPLPPARRGQPRGEP